MSIVDAARSSPSLDRSRLGRPKGCGLCGSDKLKLKYDDIAVADPGAGRTYSRSVWACDTCHAYWASLPPSTRSDDYYSEKPASDHLVLENNSNRFRQVRRVLEDAVGPGQRRILDVGCAGGAHLDVYDERWDKFGVEPAMSAIQALRARGVAYLGPSAEGAPAESFDAVTCLDVLEHIKRPRPFLNALNSCVVPGGVVAIVTGNIDSFTARWGGRRWEYYALPEHCAFYSTAALDRYWVGERGYERLLRKRSANEDLSFAYLASFMRGCVREVVLRAVPAQRARAIERAGGGRLSFFFDNMLLTYRRPSA